MNKLVTLIVAAAFTLGAGCAKQVHKDWAAAGGSRSDATVTVAYSYNPNNEIPQTSIEQAKQQAIERCQAWGYVDAEPFGLVSRRCTEPFYTMFGAGCNEMTVMQQYQCLGRGDSGSDPNFVGPIKPSK